MPAKILFTIPNFITAGSGRALLNILERLDRDRFSPMICVSKKGGKLDEEVTGKKIPLLEAPFSVSALPYFKLPLKAWRASRFFRPYKIDLWHSFHYLDDYTEPIIARMAGARAWVYTKKNMNWNRRSWYIRSLFASSIASQNTDMLKLFFTSGNLAKKTRLIPRGVDTEKFRPAQPVFSELRQNYHLGEKTLLVGTLSNLVPVKGHPTLLEAIACANHDVHLFIAGSRIDRQYCDSLSSLVQKLKIQSKVSFLDHISDVPIFLSQLDIFAFPTWAKWRMEGCPVALLEAMSCGKPCIATDIPGSRDIIENDKNGILVPPENPSELAKAITLLAGNPEMRQKFSIKARERIVRTYSIELEVERHISLYESILEPGRS